MVLLESATMTYAPSGVIAMELTFPSKREKHIEDTELSSGPPDAEREEEEEEEEEEEDEEEGGGEEDEEDG